LIDYLEKDDALVFKSDYALGASAGKSGLGMGVAVHLITLNRRTHLDPWLFSFYLHRHTFSKRFL